MATAADRHLERIVAAERQRGIVRMCGARIAGLSAFIVASLASGLAAREWHRSSTGPTLVVGYLALCVVLFVIASHWPSTARFVGFTVPLVDVPMVVAMTLMMPTPAPFTFAMPMAVLAAYVAFSAVSLSRLLLTLTYVSSIVGGALILELSSAPFEEQFKSSLVPGGVYVICLYLMTRVRSLVAESRRDDLLGKYILGERLGLGGMAEVFKATYSPEGGFERPVAVKRVLPHLATDPQFVERFRREAELTARLVHPNIVQVLDFGRHGDTYFLAMEWVDGVPLSRLVRAPLPLAAVSFIGLQLAEALDFIHTRRDAEGRPLNLVHRDLNPPNVLVSRLGDVKLADFGVARASGSGPQLTQTGAVIGKLVYMAPEQLKGTYDGRADLFALGLTLHEALTGQRVLQRDTDAAALQALLAADFRAPSAIQPDVPPELDRIVMGLLAADVAQRTATGRDLKLALMQLTGAAAPFPDGQRLLAEAVAGAPALAPPLLLPAAPAAPPPQTVTTPDRSV